MADEDRELDELRAEAEELGVKVDRRWGAERLQEEIDAALGDEETAEETPEPEAKDDSTAVHAGGYINRNDGHGWVLEEEG